MADADPYFAMDRSLCAEWGQLCHFSMAFILSAISAG
jgi:hypothetical protein